MRTFGFLGKKKKEKSKQRSSASLAAADSSGSSSAAAAIDSSSNSQLQESEEATTAAGRNFAFARSRKRADFVDPITGSPYRPDSVGTDKIPNVSMSSSSHSQQHQHKSVKISDQNSMTPAERHVTDVLQAETGDLSSGNKLDSPHVVKAYDAIPVLEQTKLPRGGVSVETKAVGRVQFGIPPETIKDSMRLGIPVPQVYIVPVERFCRELGPALGVNLAEFEFPAYFNYFVYKKRCTLVVDSVDAEDNIRRVFGETLLGPAQFRRKENPITIEEEDFAPDFPRDAMPNFQKEFLHFRIMPDGHELVIETLLDFRHFELRVGGDDDNNGLGVPPLLEEESAEDEEGSGSENGSGEEASEAVPSDLSGVENREKRTPWTYSNAAAMGDVATVWPFDATPDQIKERSVPRVEIFKMPGGTEYIIHDIDENNLIIGKARLSGHVKVSESMSVDGFGGRSILDDDDMHKKDPDGSESSLASSSLTTKTISSFHPPSFGVTVLGNSHGFDASGSVSGYVLWINGRGVMIDPPPYSSATLEREGIRPRTIVGIILTHCHADHDAGAFQKVLTGSPVVVITTPTIYKSFIRKYAALSALSPSLLRHSHRYKPAIIGQPLRFQGATFHFIYSLHTIPCVGFRVEWRGRSMVFSADHFNNPPELDKLEQRGILSKARADDLRNLPLQETDLLLHEAGAPPIHTPLDVLKKLPQRVKDRLYVVHTSAMPEGCELRVAPTGTAGTIRLDQLQPRRLKSESSGLLEENRLLSEEYTTQKDDSSSNIDTSSLSSSFAHMSVASAALTNSPMRPRQNSIFNAPEGGQAPLVALRPSSSTDAWFILNLLSAVPFLSSLSYSSTMELLETARVDVYSPNDVVVPAARRKQVLCVIWEGTCTECPVGKTSGSRRCSSKTMPVISEAGEITPTKQEVWHAGDWTGPIALQPEVNKSGENSTSSTHDIVAMSNEGVKVITIDFVGLHAILKSGSPLYRRFLDRNAAQERAKMDISEHLSTTTDHLLDSAKKELNVLELLNSNSALTKLTAIQKRHLESLAVGPVSYQQGERLWAAGTPVDKAFIIVSGSALFVQKRRNAGSSKGFPSGDAGDAGVGVSMKVDAEQAVKELGVKAVDNHSGTHSSGEGTGEHKIVFDPIYHEHAKLSRGLQKRADYLQKEGSVGSGLSGLSGETASHDEGMEGHSDHEPHLDHIFPSDESESNMMKSSRRSSVIRRRNSRARYANKVLGRLYSRRAFTEGLVFSRAHFLGDVSKMVAGLLSTDSASEYGDDMQYGFGDQSEGGASENPLATITESDDDGDQYVMHNSTLVAGKDGCVVLVFPRASLIPFLDDYPGLLLSLLGTQVVV